MKFRIYKTGEEVVIDCPAMRYQDKIDQCPHPGRFRDGRVPFEMEVVDGSLLDSIASDNESGSEQFYYEDGKLKHDSKWNNILMSVELIKFKQRKRLDREIDTELGKSDSDTLRVLKLQRQQKQIRKLSDTEIYQIAYDNLDKDGLKKPKIRAKLKKKLTN
jgi:hypothetical protein